MAESLIEVASNITFTRYLSIAGYAFFVYDLLLLLSDEIRLVWKSKRSWLKWFFLSNRYTSLVTLFLINLELSGLTGVQFSTVFCQTWLFTHAVLGTIAVQLSNALVYHRITTLWEQKGAIVSLMLGIMALTSFASLAFVIYGCINLIPTVSFFPGLNFCAVAENAPKLILSLVWAVPLLFDVAAILMILLIGLNRPRATDTSLTSAMTKDGLFFFIIIGCLRLFNVLVIAIAPTSLIFCAGYFTWALCSSLMSRFLINVQRSELDPESASHSGLGLRLAPFEMPLEELRSPDGDIEEVTGDDRNRLSVLVNVKDRDSKVSGSTRTFTWKSMGSAKDDFLLFD